MTLVIGIICGILLIYLKTKDDWANLTKPSKGWMQHNGVRQKIKQTTNRKR